MNGDDLEAAAGLASELFQASVMLEARHAKGSTERQIADICWREQEFIEHLVARESLPVIGPGVQSGSRQAQ